jgi:hypothetical protein
MPALRTKPAVCIVDICTRRADVPGAALGYCIVHYNRVRRTGEPQCFAKGCHQPIGKYGELGLCARHRPEWT